MATTDILKPDHGARRRHFIFGEEHEQLRETIRRFAISELAPHADEWEETTFPDWVFRRMGELGFLGLDKPVEYGGQGGDYYCALVLAEELGHSRSGGLVMGVAVHTDMAMPPILAFGTDEQKQQWVVPAIAGEKILCLGITEPDAGSDVAGIKTRAVRDADAEEWVINGSKTYITNGHRADAIVLVTKTDANAGYDGFTLFLVPMDLPGVIREKRLEKLGNHASDTALLAFQDVRVPDSAVLGQIGKGFYHIMCHKFAEMATKIETARQLVYMTAWRFAGGEYPVREISMAKLYASRIAVEVADECIQIHGGAGYMREYGIERAWRDLRLNRIGAGTDEIMLDVIGRSYGL